MKELYQSFFYTAFHALSPALNLDETKKIVFEMIFNHLFQIPSLYGILWIS